MPLEPLTTVLVELLPECCTEEDEKEPPVPRRRIDEQIQIWASLPNSVSRKEGWFQRGKLCFSLHSFIASRFMFLHSLDLKCCDHSFTKSLISAVSNYKFSQPNADY